MVTPSHALQGAQGQKQGQAGHGIEVEVAIWGRPQSPQDLRGNSVIRGAPSTVWNFMTSFAIVLAPYKARNPLEFQKVQFEVGKMPF